MDTKQTTIHDSYEAGKQEIIRALLAQGVPVTKARAQARARLVTGPRPTLRKLQKMIRKQIRASKESTP